MLMLNNVPTGIKKIEDYRNIVGDKAIERLKNKSKKLKNLKVLNINATAFGGGVAELLYSKVPLFNDLGLDVKWQTINGDLEFFTSTKNIHNGLQGESYVLTKHMKKAYEERNILNAEALDMEVDVVIVHDPQPLALIDYVDSSMRKNSKWIWRIHIDLTKPADDILKYLGEYISKYDAVVVTMFKYENPKMQAREYFEIPPTIDPLSPKNNELSNHTVREILNRLEIDPDRPILTQVSRYDPAKDPRGVIDVYREVKKEIKDLQLCMVASMAHDDPEGWHYYEDTVRYAANDYDIKFLPDMKGVGNTEVNAIQRASNVVIQKSKKEGFGLVVSEAMWKKKPVVATKVGGITLQIDDGVNGFLIDNTNDAAEKIKYLLSHKEVEHEMGEKAHLFVRDNFLTPKSIENWLNVFERVI